MRENHEIIRKKRRFISKNHELTRKITNSFEKSRIHSKNHVFFDSILESKNSADRKITNFHELIEKSRINSKNHELIRKNNELIEKSRINSKKSRINSKKSRIISKNHELIRRNHELIRKITN